MEGLAPVDLVALGILCLALLRGIFIGLIREAFSIGAIGGACIAVRLFHARAAAWVEQASQGQLGPMAASWLGGVALAVASVALVVFAGRMARRGARWAGLGWADRAGGAVLGAAEGVLVVGILLVLGTWLVGPGHPALVDSHALAAMQRVEQLAQQGDDASADVAAPPP